MDGMVKKTSGHKKNPGKRLSGYPRLSSAQLRLRAKNLKLVLTDNDGVLTDTGVYYSETGEVLKRFSIRDGMGVDLLREHGIETAIVTSEVSPSVQSRAEKLKMPRIYVGIKDKRAHLETIMAENNLTIDQLGYIGDDVNDLSIINTIRNAGLTGAPADAMPVVSAAVHYRCSRNAGHGAFRDFADWIIKLRE
jgi:3-deoxy-D-manno-octulosonate 8-phosphate phosphatase (KDO 8-P phosphatase)